VSYRSFRTTFIILTPLLFKEFTEGGEVYVTLYRTVSQPMQ
jgi:hypothetical protein